MHENEIAKIVIDTSFTIHKELGPGLLESVYEEIMYYELRKKHVNVERQKPVPVYWDNQEMGVGFRADLIVERKLIVELKSVETVAPVHFKRLLTYLRILDLRLGLMINFNEALLKDGIRRVANNL